MIELSRLTDCHTHTKYCCHAWGEMREYVDAAIDRGLGGIGFSIHLPAETPTDERFNVTRDEMAIIMRTVEELRTDLAGRIRISLAGEADYFPDREDAIAAMLDEYPLDYVIGSVHYVDDWPVDHPGYTSKFDEIGVMEAYRRYFNTVIGAARSGLFDILGHADVVKKFGHRPEEDWSDLAERVAEATGAAGLCIDLNTAGRVKRVGEFYPSRDLLERFARHGAGLTLGSDAHAPEEVGRHFEEAVELAVECGFSSIARFENRRRTDMPLL